MNTAIPPQALDAETAVLGAMLSSDDALTEALPLLTEQMFHRQSNGIVFRAISDLANSGHGVDSLTVNQHLDRMGWRSETLNASEVVSLSSRTPAYCNAQQYAGEVADMALRRSVSEAAQRIALAAYEEQSGMAALAYAEAQVSELATKHAEKVTEPVAALELAEWFAEQYDAPQAPRFSYCLKTLERLTGGFATGELLILGGYAKEGKSFLSQQTILDLAIKGARVGVFNLEMRKREIIRRLTTMLSNGSVPYEGLKQRTLDEVQYREMGRTLTRLGQLPFKLYTGSDWTPQSIRAVQMREHFDVIVVDHLHRFPTSAKHSFVEIGNHANELKSLANGGRSECALLLLSQLSRGNGGFSRPTTNSLRGSGMIAAEGDASLLLWREREDGIRTRRAQLLAADVRDAQGDFVVRLEFNGDSLKFEETAAA